MTITAVQPKIASLLPIDLVVYNQRLIGTRLAAGILVVMGTWVSAQIAGYTLPQTALYALGAWVLLYDAAVFLLTRPQDEDHPDLPGLRRLILVQIGLDGFSLLLFIHLTGGIYSPGLIFLGLHVIMVTILLSGIAPYLYAVGMSGALLTLGLLEASGALPHFSITPQNGGTFEQTEHIVIQSLFAAVGMGATALISASIVTPLRTRERHLQALYETNLAAFASLEIGEVLSGLAESAVKSLGARAVTVHLLELDGETLTRAAGAGEESAGLGNCRRSECPFFDRALKGTSLVLSAVEALQVGGGRLGRALIVPILGQRPLGVVSIFDPAPTSEEAPYSLLLATALAAQGAKAIEHSLAHHALHEADRQRTQFAHVLTHELRAPVTGAQSLLRLLLGNFVGTLTADQQDILKRTSRRIDSLLILINDLLSLSAARARDFQQPLEHLNILPALIASVERVQGILHEKRQTVHKDYPFETFIVSAHEQGLGRIFDNLIGNAVKYTPIGGTITVKLEADYARAEVRITVSDTGIGIPPEAIARLGEEFYRAPNAKESGIVGTGLGITTVNQMIAHFKGRLEVESEVGMGTTFRVILPLVKVQPPAVNGSVEAGYDMFSLIQLRG